MPGRRPKPRELRVLGGNAGKRALPPALELEPHSGTCPRALSGLGRAIWDRQFRALARIGALKRVHESGAVIACEAIADALDARESALERGRIARELLSEIRRVQGDLETGAPEALESVARAAEAVLRSLTKAEPTTKLRAEARQWLSEFGLTPASSAKLAPGAPEQSDPLEDFLG